MRTFLRILSESLSLAFQQLRVNKLRSLLSLLGVTIGIFSIIAILSAVDSIQKDVRNNLNKFGKELITIEKWPAFTSTDYPWWKYVNRPETNIREFDYIKHQVHSAEVISFIMLVPRPQIKYQSKKVGGIDVLASSHEVGEALNLEVEYGRYFTPQESNSGMPVAVIGAGIAEEVMKDTDDPLGKDLSILDRDVQVVGVLRMQGKDFLGFDFDKKIYVPYQFVENTVYVDPNQSFPQMIIKPKSLASVDLLVDELEGKMRKVRRLRPNEENNFAINKLSMASEMLSQGFQVLNVVGWIIGLFALAVGGFGIANIMFVSVSERTNIIGIKKALGSTRFFILTEFLIESVILCCLGGLIGIGLVALLGAVATKSAGLNLSVSLSNVFLGVAISTIIGLVAGLFPALRAANLNPVDAIRAK